MQWHTNPGGKKEVEKQFRALQPPKKVPRRLTHSMGRLVRRDSLDEGTRGRNTMGEGGRLPSPQTHSLSFLRCRIVLKFGTEFREVSKEHMGRAKDNN